MMINFDYIIRLSGLEKPTGLLVERIRKPRENPREKERETQESEGASPPPRTCSGLFVWISVEEADSKKSSSADREGSPPVKENETCTSLPKGNDSGSLTLI